MEKHPVKKPTMTRFLHRPVAGALAFAVALGLAACAQDDGIETASTDNTPRSTLPADAGTAGAVQDTAPGATTDASSPMTMGDAGTGDPALENNTAIVDASTPAPTGPASGSSAGGQPVAQGTDAHGSGHFATIDANRDGMVSADENTQGATSMFRSLDTDSDGSLTSAELAASAHASGGASFAAMDANGDGRLSTDEYAKASMKRFGELDTDRNGSLSATEQQSDRVRTMGDVEQ